LSVGCAALANGRNCRERARTEAPILTLTPGPRVEVQLRAVGFTSGGAVSPAFRASGGTMARFMHFAQSPHAGQGSVAARSPRDWGCSGVESSLSAPLRFFPPGVGALPWNVALWWQRSRLRLAVEMDCDARVL